MKGEELYFLLITNSILGGVMAGKQGVIIGASIALLGGLLGGIE